MHVSGREDNSPGQIWQPWVTQKGYRRENIPIDEPLTDPLRMIIKSNSLNYDLDDLKKRIVKSNPTLKIKRLEYWNNGFVDMSLNEETNLTKVEIDGYKYSITPFIVKPNKCSHCQK